MPTLSPIASGREAILALLVAGAAALASGGAAKADESQCKALSGRKIASAAIALPTSGGEVVSAEYVSRPGTRAYCKVLGHVAPVDPKAPMVNFEVNLPDAWNGKAIQYGGGGLNGTLVTGLTGLRDSPPTVPMPLEQGYVTFGTDAGHQTARGDDLQAFAVNEEALINHAYGAYKKTHDAALSLVSTYFDRRPSRMYFFGGSEGGREAMVAVQRFPADYDGAVATVPVLSWTGVNIAGYRQWQATLDGGWMNAAKVALLQKATLEACDSADGLADGVMTAYLGCAAAAPKLKSLRCPGGGDSGDTCLSDKQIALVETVRSPTPYGYAINHGETGYPAYPTGAEANPGAMIPTILAPKQPAPDDQARMVYAAGDIRYFVVQDPTFRAPLDLKKYESRIRWVSQQMDMNDPDLSAFKARGGKLIIKDNGGDYLVAPQSVFRYYDNVVRTMGRASAEQFVRLYVAPWTDHGGQGRRPDNTPVPDRVDLLGLLDAWVEHGQAPADVLTLTAYDKDAALSSWPLCRYPNYPRYDGKGDTKQAASYRCVPLASKAR